MVLPRLTYAGVTSTLALFIALGGGAYAAATLPANSVGAKQIKKSAVERAKIKNNAVDGSKVLDNALTGDDVKESTLGKVQFAGVADNATNAGNASRASAALALDKINYRSAPGNAPPSSVSVGATAACDPGQRAVGGGVRVDNPAPVFPIDSYPEPGGTGWTAHIATDGSGGTGFTVTAICVPAAAVG
jgi:hypothetical protein